MKYFYSLLEPEPDRLTRVSEPIRVKRVRESLRREHVRILLEKPAQILDPLLLGPHSTLNLLLHCVTELRRRRRGVHVAEPCDGRDIQVISGIVIHHPLSLTPRHEIVH